MKNNRYEYNKKILEALGEAVEHNKDLRFIQLLWALRLVTREDRFYEESEETYERLTHEN